MRTANPLRVTVLLSGSGTTFAALERFSHEPHCHYKITDVISDNPEAQGLHRAQQTGTSNHCVPFSDFAACRDFNQALLDQTLKCEPELVVLAGYMRIVDPSFVEAFDGCLLNIHPSLLPKFPGLNTYRRALAERVIEHGTTVHFVNNVLDGGPLIAQAVVKIDKSDREETLSARVQRAERMLYPVVINWFAQRRLAQRDSHVWLDGVALDRPRQFQTHELTRLFNNQ